MRWKAIIVLLAIAMSIAVPPSFSLAVYHNEQAEIGVLDVCHATTPALSSNGDMLSLSVCPDAASTTFASIVISLDKPFFTQTLFTFTNEQPPKS
jgi:hypothetical protein